VSPKHKLDDFAVSLRLSWGGVSHSGRPEPLTPLVCVQRRAPSPVRMLLRLEA